MAKYSYEFKKQVVDDYKKGEGGYKELGKRYGIDESLIRTWIAIYNKLGDEGLQKSKQQKNYSFEFKKHMVELYLSSEKSYRELAIANGINNPSLLTRWVNEYRIAGPDALFPKQKGVRRKMNKPPKMKESSNERDPYLKQLEEENLKLRIENAYLKELRRLRLEEEALLREQQGSSTASENHTN